MPTTTSAGWHVWCTMVPPRTFKKASNMNYGLTLSLKMEHHLTALLVASKTDRDKVSLEHKVLEIAIEETFKESRRRWRPWASNRRSICTGKIILIINSDTVVPEVWRSRLLCHSLLTRVFPRIVSGMLPANLQSHQRPT
jgi:hypothetical protein